MSTPQLTAQHSQSPRTQAIAEEVSFGSTVSFTDQRAGRDQTFTIVASHDAKPHEGTLSVASPVAHALIHHKAGDLVQVPTPSGPRPLLITAIA
jgi:transcription elongation GreA/GreB family factor